MDLPRVSFAAVAAAVFAAAGCSGVGPVSGVVTYADQPVVNAVVMLYSPEGETYQGVTGEKGEYSIPGVPSGEYPVTVAALPKPAESTGQQKEKESVEQKAATSTSVDLPAAYATPDTSGLTITVSGSTTFDIKIERR